MRSYFQAQRNGGAVVYLLLAAVVFFSRGWLVQTWGSPLPFWDQWDAEAIGLYPPWVKGSLHWADLFRLHNEHRIALTRLADLALFNLYNGWNPWAEMLLNAALHAATAALLAIIFWPTLAGRSRSLFVLGVAILFTSACGWQNALYGFQSQVYFANLLAVAACAGLGGDSPFRLRWWLGLTAAILAFFANAGGVLAVMALLIVQTCFSWGRPRSVRSWIATMILGGTLIVGLALGTEAPQHAAFHAKTAVQWLDVFTHCLSWPWINVGAIFVVMQLPLAWLAVDRWRTRTPLNATECCAFALGLFAILQAAAIAHSRGAVLPESRPISRYHDPLLLGAAAQLFAAIQLFTGQTRLRRIAALVWCGVTLAGLIHLTETNFTLHLPFKRVQDQADLAIVRAYAATGDFSAFTSNPNFYGPHPDPRVVQRVLDQPEMRAVLPKAVLTPEAEGAAGQPPLIRYSLPLLAASAVGLLGMLAWLYRAKSDRTDPTMPPPSGPS